MTYNWTNRHVLITGASSGIGYALAKAVARRGATVGLVARRHELLEKLAADLQSQGRQAAWAAADVSDPRQMEAAAAELAATLGPCEVLIAAAGIYRQTAGTAFDAAACREVLNVNLGGVVNAIGAVLPGMVARRSGHLVAVSSVAAALGLPEAAGYCASKAGLLRLMESLRLDLRRHGVAVTTVCPGYVDTAMITEQERQTLRGLLSADQAAERICRAIERRVKEAWFPWSTACSARLARLLPAWLYDRWIGNLEAMEEG